MIAANDNLSAQALYTDDEGNALDADGNLVFGAYEGLGDVAEQSPEVVALFLRWKVAQLPADSADRAAICFDGSGRDVLQLRALAALEALGHRTAGLFAHVGGFATGAVPALALCVGKGATETLAFLEALPAVPRAELRAYVAAFFGDTSATTDACSSLAVGLPTAEPALLTEDDFMMCSDLAHTALTANYVRAGQALGYRFREAPDELVARSTGRGDEP